MRAYDCFGVFFGICLSILMWILVFTAVNTNTWDSWWLAFIAALSASNMLHSATRDQNRKD